MIDKKINMEKRQNNTHSKRKLDQEHIKPTNEG